MGFVAEIREDLVLLSLPIVLLIVAAVIADGVMLYRHWRAKRDPPSNLKADQRELQLTLLLVVEFAALLVILRPAGMRWQLAIALLPLLLVAYHAGHLWLEQPNPQASHDADNATVVSFKRVRTRILHHYGWEAIFARYVIPGMIIAIVSLVEFRFINDPGSLEPGIPAGTVDGAFKYGLIGAYLYIFLELGRRSVQHDITPVSLVWCLITLVVGPALAAVIPRVFNAATGVGASGTGGLWNEKALWLFAGYSPRLVFRTLALGVTTSLRAESAVQEENQIPLGRLAGMGRDEAERLAEEGIKDVHALACVDAVRLMRDTRFDNWRIASWVDQAILLGIVPDAVWRALTKRGYQGATDTFVLIRRDKGKTEDLRKALTDVDVELILGDIAKEADVKEPVIREMLIRISNDLRTIDLSTLIRALSVPTDTNESRGSPTSSSHGGSNVPGGAGQDEASQGGPVHAEHGDDPPDDLKSEAVTNFRVHRAEAMIDEPLLPEEKREGFRRALEKIKERRKSGANVDSELRALVTDLRSSILNRGYPLGKLGPPLV